MTQRTSHLVLAASAAGAAPLSRKERKKEKKEAPSREIKFSHYKVKEPLGQMRISALELLLEAGQSESKPKEEEEERNPVNNFTLLFVCSCSVFRSADR